MPLSLKPLQRKYNRITILQHFRVGQYTNIKGLCECGSLIIANSYSVTSGRTKSCGCLQRELFGSRRFKHGKTNTIEYRTWQAMKRRCYNKNTKDFRLYGKRGITVCKRWKNSFVNFLTDMGNRPSKLHSIDRINNNGNYTPVNCKWSTDFEQNNNRRRF